jgi:hypothetical protein
MTEPDLVIIRGTGIEDVDGKWLDRAGMQTHVGIDGKWVELEATGEFEVLKDGAVAEVFRPRETK